MVCGQKMAFTLALVSGVAGESWPVRMQQMQTRRAPLTGPADNLTTKAVAHAMGLGKEQ